MVSFGTLVPGANTPGGFNAPSQMKAPAVPSTLSPRDRDIVIRTVLGEAMNESDTGQAGVAHVIRNRVGSKRYPNTPAEVAKQNNGKGVHQFSAWNNAGLQGNDLVRKYGPGTAQYERTGAIVDAVFSGNSPDPTGGATHYYAPQGMPGGRAPYWWGDETTRAGGVVTIGNHRFAGNPALVGQTTNVEFGGSLPDPMAAVVGGETGLAGAGVTANAVNSVTAAPGAESSGTTTSPIDPAQSAAYDRAISKMAASESLSASQDNLFNLIAQARQRRSSRQGFLTQGSGNV